MQHIVNDRELNARNKPKRLSAGMANGNWGQKADPRQTARPVSGTLLAAALAQDPRNRTNSGQHTIALDPGPGQDRSVHVRESML